MDHFVRHYRFFSGLQVFEYRFFLVRAQGDQLSLPYALYVFAVGHFSQGLGILFHRKDARTGFDKLDVNVFAYAGF